MTAATAMSVSEHIKKVPPAVRPTVQAARRMVKTVAPTAKEVAYRSAPPRSRSAMWKLARYVVDDTPVVAIGTFPNHATLFFFRGVELDDPRGLLEGGGKVMRSITLREPADAERPAVKRFVRKAAKLAASS